MATTWYNEALRGIAEGEIDLALDDIRVLILEVDDPGSLTVQRSRATVAAILATAATEATSTGYARQALANQSVTKDDTGDVVDFDADDVTFTAISQSGSESWASAIVYKHVGADSANIPITRHDGGFPVTPNGEDIHLRFHADGIARLRHPA